MGLLRKLLAIFKKDFNNTDQNIIKGKVQYSLARPEKIKNTLIPKVKSYKLEDLFVAKVIRVDYIEGEDDEYEDFDYDTLSGETPPPITEEDYHTSIVERLIIARPAMFDNEEKEFYDIFTGFGYDRFDFASEVGEEYVDNITSFQTWFKYYIKVNDTKVFPNVSYTEIIKMKNTAKKYMSDIEEMEESGLIKNLNDFLEECPSFEQLFKAWYILSKYQVKSLNK